MAASEIEWTEATWNPVTGCSMVSPGCTNCYAMRMAGRLERMGVSKYAGTARMSGKRHVWTGSVFTHEKALQIPLSWNKPKKIFVNSMSDLFHEEVPEEFVMRVWDTMQAADWHTFQILTKRPERMRQLVEKISTTILPNVWLGTSVESADYIDRIEALRSTPAAVRFVSFEPLLSDIGDIDLSQIDWAIVGGESGPGSRPMKQEWVEKLHDRCRLYGTAFFFKQWGGTNKKKAGRKLGGRTWDETPSAGGARLTP